MKFTKVLLFFLFFIPTLLFPQENNSLFCADGIDNDGDGLIDCDDPDCLSLPNLGCITCMGDSKSFADTVLFYKQECPDNLHTNPELALGVSDFLQDTSTRRTVSLGFNGVLILGFTDNVLTNSGSSDPDLFIFETGFLTEAMVVELRPFNQATINILQVNNISDNDSDGYYDFGIVSGSTTPLNLDDFVIGYENSAIKFDAIKISSLPDETRCNTPRDPGPDIDAVCALSSESVDCNGVVNGESIIDECGICLELSHPNFNRSCADCSGNPNGQLVFDECRNCLATDDPNFNLSCIDCVGSSRVDDCGICLDTLDVNFNMSCLDCAGVPSGNSIVDDCGVCLPIDSPNFNQSCADCNGTPNGSFVIDSCGVCTDRIGNSFNQSCIDCAGIPFGSSIYDECGVCIEIGNAAFNQSCTDCQGIVNGGFVIDECGECLSLSDEIFNRTCLEDVYIPSAFSPNNDGINDIFKIYSDERSITIVKTFRIFDKWGSLVFSAADFRLTDGEWWDGTSNAEKSPLGVYVYSIEIEYFSGEVSILKGSVVLVR